MVRAYLGLGSNLGNREMNIQRALRLLATHKTRVGAISPLYETEPWGMIDQPRFLNAVCALDTNYPPHALLTTLKEIEATMGRIPSMRYGPRLIDLDILLYGDQLIDTPDLKIPHPEMLRRAFVLVPLATIAPETIHPATNLTIAEHLCSADISGIALYPPGLSNIT